MATSDSDSIIASDSDFDPVRYEPAVLRYQPVGLKLYNPKDTAYEPEVVLREPNKHLSVHNRERKRYVRGYGGSGNVKEFYNALPPQAKKLVDGTGFKGFIDILGETSNDRVQLTALAERWWDTTNTLHLPFGEATLTPLDFAAITGIRVGGNLIPYDMGLYKKHDALEYFLGRVPKKISDVGTVKYTWFYECFQDDTKAKRIYTTKQEFEQLARAFLLYVFGAALFSNKDSRVHLHYLGGMKDLAAVKDFDWGGAALATLYGHMSVASRTKKPSMGGFWRVWEIWSYEFLGMFVPQNKFKNQSVIPRGLKWQKASQGTKKGGKCLEAYRAFLDGLQENQVKWDVWARIEEEATSDLLRSRSATGRRILLDGPFCREWYLGERVVRQSLGYDTFRVPKPIPLLSSRSKEAKELLEWFDGEDANDFLEEGGDYAEYKELRLMKPFNASQTQSNPLAEQRTRVEPAVVIGGDRARPSQSAKLPEPPQRVDYMLSDGIKKFIDIPSPVPDAYPLLPDLELVPREFAQSWVDKCSGLETLVRKMAITMATAGLELPSTSGDPAQNQKNRMVPTRETPVPAPTSVPVRTRKGKQAATSHESPAPPPTTWGRRTAAPRHGTPGYRGKKATVRRRSKVPSPVVSSEDEDGGDDDDDSDEEGSENEEENQEDTGDGDSDDNAENEENEEEEDTGTDTKRPTKKAKKRR